MSAQDRYKDLEIPSCFGAFYAQDRMLCLVKI